MTLPKFDCRLLTAVHILILTCCLGLVGCQEPQPTVVTTDEDEIAKYEAMIAEAEAGSDAEAEADQE